jgi:hypothetical protein
MDATPLLYRTHAINSHNSAKGGIFSSSNSRLVSNFAYLTCSNCSFQRIIPTSFN